MSRLVYFPALDGVRFLDDLPPRTRADRAVSAAGVLMLGMLVGDVTPVLSQSQAFDNGYLLDSVARGDADAIALLQLVRRGHIQVRLLEPHRTDRSAVDPDHHTLLEAFRSALARPDYMFSAWTELEDPELRAELSADLTRAESIGSPTVIRRMTGLRELDAALRHSGTTVFAARQPASALEDLVQDGLAALAGVGGADHLTAELRAMAEAVPAPERDTRSGWYRLLDGWRPEECDVVIAVRDLVDGAYHSIVRRSLGVSGMHVDCESGAGALALANLEPDSDVGERSFQAGVSDAFGRWLTWSAVHELREQLSVLTPARRLEYLSAGVECATRIERRRGVGVALRVALPGLGSAAATAAGGAAGVLLAGVPGVAAGAMAAGVVTLLTELVRNRAAKPAPDRGLEGWPARGDGNRAGWTWTTGSGSWLRTVEHG